MNVLDWIAKWADYTPYKVALTSYASNEKYTYKDVHIYANRLIEKFHEAGYREGDRIAVIAEHNVAYIVLFVACQRMGLILVPLNYRMASRELDKLVKDCNPRILIFSETLRSQLNELTLEGIETVNMERVIEAYKAEVSVAERDYDIKEDNPLFIFYTSGTTGLPKGVIYTNKMLFWNSLNTSMQLGITYRDSTINTLPPYHTSGWNVFITPLLHKGGHIGMMEKFDAQKALCLLELEKTTLFMALPTMLLMMQKTEVFKRVNLKKLRYIISGGEKVNAELVSFWKKEKDIYIRPGYGLTEAGPSITSLHHDMALLKPNSIGKSNFYLDLKIVNENDEPLGVGEIGELCIKGDIVTPGYWNNSVVTKSKIVDGWLHTGDLALKDEEGFLYLKGRIDDMYISGGENIYPQEIELLLENYTGVTKASVFSVKCERWGACGIAFVESKDKAVTSEVLREYLKGNIADFKQPKYIFVLDEIPLTSLSKVSRKKLNKYFNTLKL
ncbi:class I adenylate-forming enzyme family protein [Mangrovimonas sp. DI 80]|uniref:class I adenylate-forming enzyme family protein n=1 Tax=Mangrovimonas sp. DI 80 TaxID=1779330 RepID=UPI000976D4C2|nr:class I adenylate-forming enzyme family protein [Mangrovimonas sp. DI 80]OMP31662.1 hypothetical protein BKM32_00915 [Mangrovimonas sp. DI 80]